MRRRWAIWILGGILVVAFGLLLSLPKAGRVSARVLGITNAPGPYYVLQVTNGTRTPHTFIAWTEFAEDEAWHKVSQGAHSFTIGSREALTTTLPKTAYEKRRITLTCFPVNTKSWQNWRDRLLALARIKTTQSYKVYVDVE